MFLAVGCESIHYSDISYASLTLSSRDSVIVMSLGASRIYRGLVDYPFSDSPPFKETAVKDRPRELRHSSFGSSQQNYFGEGTHSAGGAKVYAHALSPGTP